MLSDKASHIIDLLVNGEPLNAEQEKLYLELQDDTSFAEEYAFRKDMRASLRTIGREELKSHLKQLDNKSSKEKKYWFFLGFLIGLGVVLGLFYYLNKPKEVEYFAQYFEPYPNVIDPMTKGEEMTLSPYLEYEKKNYSKALEGLILDDSAASHFYQGVIYNIQEDHKLAKEAYLECIKSNDDAFIEKAQWYLALTYLKLEEEKKAQDMLEAIVSTENHFYIRQARKILTGK